MKTAFATLALSAMLAQQLSAQHANAAKGFSPNGVYQVNGIDNISAFNGNLTLTIPIGQVYSIGGGLTYQLRLYANGNLWEPEERNLAELSNDCSAPPHTMPEACVQAFPDRRGNAGVGWTLSLGRLFPRLEQTNEWSNWVYESPSGAEHRFYPEPNGTVFVTKDGSNLRLRTHPTSETEMYIDFPNGEVHTFNSDEDPNAPNIDNRLILPWLLTKIASRHPGSALTITHDRSVPTAPKIVLNDGSREQTIHFVPLPFESGTVPAWSSPPNDELVNQRMLVSAVDVAVFGGQTAHYTLNYTETDLFRPDWHNIPIDYAPAKGKVQLLTSIGLSDGTSFAFQYRNQSDDSSGLPKRMDLPTGGRIEWEYMNYQFPAWTADHPGWNNPPGVQTRKVFADLTSTTPLGTWTHSFNLDGHWQAEPPPRQSKVTIEDPLGNKTVSYFDVGSWDPAHPGYGLPFTPQISDSGQRRLSQEFVPAGPIPSTIRSVWVRYANDLFPPRVESTRTVYHDDSNAFLNTDFSDYAGYGLFRTATTTGTDIPTRVSTTLYTPVATTNEWFPSLHSHATTTENGRTLRVESCFDTTTGFLNERRTIKDTTAGTRGSNDVVVRFTPDLGGNVQSEAYYGGDDAPTWTTNCPTGTSGNPRYRIDHIYQYGSLKHSEYKMPNGDPFGLVFVDNDIDQNTGLVSKSRDTAQVETLFTYDTSGRPSWVKPPGRAWTKYTFPTFTGPSDRSILVEQFPNGQTTGALTYSRHEIDALGRVIRETMPRPVDPAESPQPQVWESRRETVYNILGWQTEVTELGTATTLPRTIFTHDNFGRVKTATGPDGSLTTFTYTGIRAKSRTSKISMSVAGADAPVVTTEQYDLLGRLIRVTEPSGPTSAASLSGASVATEYSYDPADRLVFVKMTGAENVVQSRTFDYDGRGFLRWESHPEAGMTSYTYDVRGNVLTKTQSAAQSEFDLQYDYDEAGRLLRVDGRNPFYDLANPNDPNQPPFRVLKTFTYATDNGPFSDNRKGKLLTASRYNYDPSDGGWDDRIYKVAETYMHRDVAGRKTGRITRITYGDEIDETFWDTLREIETSLEYNDLDQPSLVRYPMCIGCGAPPHPLRLQTFGYERGRVTSLTGFGTLTYWPNGMWKQLSRASGMTDTQIPDPSGMSRPASITSGLSDACTMPQITGDPVGGRITSTTPSVTMTVTSSGTAPLSYQWWNHNTGQAIVGANGPSYTGSPNETTEYSVEISNNCGSVTSSHATITVGACVAPTIAGPGSQKNLDGSYTLVANPDGTQPSTYLWRRASDNAFIGDTRTVNVGVLSTTTTYNLTATNECGNTTGSVTIYKSLQITTTGLVATRTGTNQITVSWPAVPGATKYKVERRDGIDGWEVLPEEPTVPFYVDNLAFSGATFAYRVKAIGANSANESAYSNADVASTIDFQQVISGGSITASSVAPMLAAVNAVRAVSGWPAVTWTHILSPSDPIPAPSAAVRISHIAMCRARMNEALQALGVPVAGYTDPDLHGKVIKAVHINEVMGRTQ